MKVMFSKTGSILLPTSCKINYFDMQHNYDHMRFIYVNMQDNHDDMPQNYVNM